MSENLRDTFPPKDKIISISDEIILETEDSGTVRVEFGDLRFSSNNFPDININGLLTAIDSLSSYINTTTNNKLSSFETPEILALQYKVPSNIQGDTIGIAGHVLTDIPFEEHVNTIKNVDLTNNLPISKNATTGKSIAREYSSTEIILSPGVYRVECTGTFTLAGVPGGVDLRGKSFGNGDKAYIVLELFKETTPNEILLYSTPSFERATSGNIDETSYTSTCYMYGYISVCNPSILKLRAKTAGEYIIGSIDNQSAGDFSDTFLNPIQIIFEKINSDPLIFDIASGELDTLTGFTPLVTTTLAPPSLPPLPPTVVNTTTSAPGVVNIADPIFIPGTSTSSSGSTNGGGGGGGGGGGSGSPGGPTREKSPELEDCRSLNLCSNSWIGGGRGRWDAGSLDLPGWAWYSEYESANAAQTIHVSAGGNLQPILIQSLHFDPGTAEEKEDREWEGDIWDGAYLMGRTWHENPETGEGGWHVFDGTDQSGKSNYDSYIESIESNCEANRPESNNNNSGHKMCDMCRDLGNGPKPYGFPVPPMQSSPHSNQKFCQAEGSETDSETDGEGGEEEKPKCAQPSFSGWLTPTPGTPFYDAASAEFDYQVYLGYYLPNIYPDMGDGEFNHLYDDDTTGDTYTCNVSLIYPCYVKDFGSSKYKSSVNPDGTKIDDLKPEKRVKDAISGFEKLKPVVVNSLNADKRKTLHEEAEKLFQVDIPPTLETLKQRYIDNYIEGSLNIEASRVEADNNWENQLADNVKLGQRTKEEFELEDKIIPKIKILLITPFTDYLSVANDKNLEVLLVELLEDMDNLALLNKYIGINKDISKSFLDNIKSGNIGSRSESNFAKLYKLAEYVIQCDFFVYTSNLASTVGSGLDAVKFWQRANTKSGFLSMRAWWKSNLLATIIKDSEGDPDRAQVAGDLFGNGKNTGGRTSSVLETSGNCCMRRESMIIEAYFWNKDLLIPIIDEDGKVTDHEKWYEKEIGGKEVWDQELIKRKYPWMGYFVDIVAILNSPLPNAKTADGYTAADGTYHLGCIE